MEHRSGTAEEDFEGKIAPSLEAMGRRVRALKGQGRRIVFTNGAFDIVHVGHLRSLQGAKALGDHLIVGVNSDASVRRAKGPGRPIFPQEERVEILAALECVDSVVVFEEPTADRILECLQPHIHAKGPDYTGGAPEKATVGAFGGRLAIVGDPKSHSTTDVIGKILAAAGSRGQPPEEDRRKEH